MEESHWDRGNGHRGVRSDRRHPVDELGCVVLQVEQAEVVAVRRELVGVFTENLAGPAPASIQAYGFGPEAAWQRGLASARRDAANCD